MTKPAKLLWMDLEMTGLDPVEDRILEVAVIATDWDMNEIATYEAVKKVGPNLVKKRMAIPFWEKFSDPTERIILAGNSIHQDRKFVENEWGRLNERLHYRMLDVTAWKVVFEGKYRKKFAKPEQHRALEDIRGSIMELKYYLGKVKV